MTSLIYLKLSPLPLTCFVAIKNQSTPTGLSKLKRYFVFQRKQKAANNAWAVKTFFFFLCMNTSDVSMKPSEMQNELEGTLKCRNKLYTIDRKQFCKSKYVYHSWQPQLLLNDENAKPIKTSVAPFVDFSAPQFL